MARRAGPRLSRPALDARRWLAVAALAVLAVLASPPQIAAQPLGPADPVARLSAGRPSDAGSAQALTRWRQQAQAQGSVRLIASLAEAQPAGAVRTAAGRSAQARVFSQVIARLGGRARAARGLDVLPVLVVDVDAAGVDALVADPAIATLEDDRALSRALADSVPLVEADQLWAQGYRGTGWSVAILDDGVDTGHVAFGGRVVSEACYSGHGSPAASLCPGGVLTSTAPGSAAACPTCSHGTHITGTAAGSTGVAPEASIIAMQVFSNDGLTYFSDVLQAIDRVLVLAAVYDIAAVNMSLGTGTTYTTTCDSVSAAVFSAFASLRAAGIAPVVAAGNSSTASGLEFPACLSNAISVGSTSKADVVEAYSDAASFLQLLAPGGSITAPVPGGGTGVKSGTSMATPHVVGAWALLRQRVPTASVDTVLSALKATGKPVLDPRNGLTFPRIRIAAAADALATFGVTPATWSPGVAGGTQVVALTSSSPAATWTATSSGGWLTIVPASGTGSASVTLTAAAHTTSALSRSATATIAGRTVTVTQAGATPTFTISPGTWSPGATGGTQVETVTSSLADAPWSAVSTADWLSVSASGGIGSGSVTLTAAAHTASSLARSTTTTIAGLPVSVTQAGVTPTFTLLPTTMQIAASGETRALSLTGSPLDAVWTASSTQPWLTVSPTSGTGSASMSVTAAPHTSSVSSRTASVNVGGQTLVVTQGGAAPSFSISPVSTSIAPAGTTISLSLVASPSDAPWSAASDVAWATVMPSSGIGSAVLTVSVAAHTTSVATRVAGITVAGQGVVITQAGAMPSFTASPGLIDVVAGGGTSSVSLTSSAADATWIASTSSPWLTVQPQAGTGSATVLVSVAANASVLTRTGLVTIAGRTVSITQASEPAGFTVSPSSITMPESGGAASIGLAASAPDASWSATSAVPWIAVSPVSGEGSATISLTVAPTTPLRPRSGIVTIAGRAVVVDQAGGDPTASISDPSWIAPAGGGSRTVTLDVSSSTGSWLAISDAPWLTVSPARGTGDAPVIVAALPATSTGTGLPVGVLPSPIASTSATLSVSQAFGSGVRTGVIVFVPLPPTDVHTRYLAEGAVSAFFDMRLALLNPGDVATTATVTFLQTGHEPLDVQVDMPARTRRTLWPRTIAGLADAQFSTTVTAAQPLVVDRTMTWGASSYGSHAETATSHASPRWYLAEGATHSGFALFYLLQNPGPTDVAVRVRYLRASSSPLEKTYMLAPRSRTNVWVNLEEFPGLGTALAAAEVSASVETLGGEPIIVERAMYRSAGGRTFEAGHESMGVSTPSTRWFLAEGRTGPFFDEFILIANPTDAAATVRLTYLLDTGTTHVRTMTAPANARTSVWVDRETFPGEAGEPLADVALSATVESLNGVPLIVERAMWWPGDGTTWHEAHSAAGAVETGTAWALAEGEVGGSGRAQTYVLMANTSAVHGRARVTLLFEDGATLSKTYALQARSRTNAAIGPDFGDAVNGRRFGVIVEALGLTDEAPVPQIVVERAMYSDAAGVTLAAGSNAVATKLR